MTTKTEQHWADFILDLACEKPSAYVQIRKVFRSKTLIIPFEDWDGITIKTEQMGYSAGDSKMKQLRRNYLNVEELEKARDTLISRMKKQQSCITARFGNKEKDSRSQGFCMQNITLNYIEKPEPGASKFIVELYYRSTEVGQKFLADLMFLDEIVFPIILKGLPKPDGIVFKFSTLYLSSMFLPIVFQRTDPIYFLKKVHKYDNKWFTRCVRMAVYKWMQENCGYNYRTRVKMHDVFREHVYKDLNSSTKKKIMEIVK